MKYYKHYIVDNHKIKEAALLRQPLFFVLFADFARLQTLQTLQFLQTSNSFKR